MAFNLPQVIVEWAPNDGPLVASPTWVNITQYVRETDTSTGRQYELDQFRAGQMNLTLITAKAEGVAVARLFDYEYTSGTYFGKLIPNKQIRITAVANSTTFDVFRGYVTRWGQTIEQESVYVTPVTIVDAFIWFEQTKLPSSAWSLEVQRNMPTCWLRLGEDDTSRVTDSSPGGNYGIFDNIAQGAEGLVPNDDDGAVGGDEVTPDSRATIQNPALITGYPFTVSFLFKLNADFPDHFHVAFAGLQDPRDFNPGLAFAIEYRAPYIGKMVALLTSGANFLGDVSDTPVNDGKPHHMVEVFTNSTTSRMYMDGVANFGGFAGPVTWPGNVPNGWTLGNYTDNAFGDFNFIGVLDELCVWNGTALDTTTIGKHALAAKTGWAGDDTGTRVDRFLDAIDWPSALRDTDTGISILGPANWSQGESALSVMQNWANTEYGLFYIGPDGKVVWRSRHYRYLNARAKTSQATFGDQYAGGGALPYLADGFSMPRDETLIRNPVTASRDGGVSVTVKDQTLIDNTYGPRWWASPPTEDSLDSAVRDRATWLLARYKNTATRLRSMTVSFRRITNAANQATVLGLKIGDRITVKRTPLGLGNQTTVDLWIEGIAHTITKDDYRVTFVASPVETQAYLVLDDATLGLLDTGTLAY